MDEKGFENRKEEQASDQFKREDEKAAAVDAKDDEKPADSDSKTEEKSAKADSKPEEKPAEADAVPEVPKEEPEAASAEKELEKKDAEDAPVCSWYHEGSNASWRLEGDDIFFNINLPSKKGKWYSVFGIGESMEVSPSRALQVTSSHFFLMSVPFLVSPSSLSFFLSVILHLSLSLYPPIPQIFS